MCECVSCVIVCFNVRYDIIHKQEETLNEETEKKRKEKCFYTEREVYEQPVTIWANKDAR